MVATIYSLKAWFENVNICYSSLPYTDIFENYLRSGKFFYLSQNCQKSVSRQFT